MHLLLSLLIRGAQASQRMLAPLRRFSPLRTTIAMAVAMLTVMVALPTLALAQEGGTIGAPGFNIGLLFTDVAALAAFIIPAVAFVRSHIWTTLDGWPAIVVTFLIGIGLSLVGFYMNLLHVATIGECISFGLTAAVLAMGGVKTASKVMSARVNIGVSPPIQLPNPPLYPTDPVGEKPSPQTDPR